MKRRRAYDLLIGTRRDPQYRQGGSRSTLIALRNHPLRTCGHFFGHGAARHDAGEVRRADEISATFIFRESADRAPWKKPTRLLDLRRHCIRISGLSYIFPVLFQTGARNLSWRSSDLVTLSSTKW